MKKNATILIFMGLLPVLDKHSGNYIIEKDGLKSNSKSYDRAIEGFGKLTIYHKSWCWLMPVVQKCKEVKLGNLDLNLLMDKINDILCDDLDVGKLYEKVVAFIEYYNAELK